MEKKKKLSAEEEIELEMQKSFLRDMQDIRKGEDPEGRKERAESQELHKTTEESQEEARRAREARYRI